MAGGPRGPSGAASERWTHLVRTTDKRPGAEGPRILAGSVRSAITRKAWCADRRSEHAFLEGRGYVAPEDIKSVGMEVLRHRVITTYEAEAEGLTSEDVIRRVMDTVRVP